MRNETDLKVAIARSYLQAEKKKEELLPGPPKTIIRFVRSTKAQNPIPEAASGRPEMSNLPDTKTAPRRPGLVEISVDVVSRSDLALRAVQGWKSDAKLHTEFESPGGYYNWLCAQQDGIVGPRTNAKKKEEKR